MGVSVGGGILPYAGAIYRKSGPALRAIRGTSQDAEPPLPQDSTTRLECGAVLWKRRFGVPTRPAMGRAAAPGSVQLHRMHRAATQPFRDIQQIAVPGRSRFVGVAIPL
ncbi:hypothetical protein C1S65_07965 [Pseudomonas putida]|uniref:Uncharacterized protein n=1 Tax=Pseudomonas putida TaxID=303 RepID=A0AAD0L521_PSEPU|nr:hypothetical protein C1S65_07965 [Pseudomonas putida]